MSPRISVIALCALIGLLFVAPSSIDAQTLQLGQRGNEAPQISATVGDTLSLQIRANLGSLSASGLTLFVRFSATAFAVVDADGQAANGVQPFGSGSLFADAVEFDNSTVSDSELLAATDWQLIGYAAVLASQARDRGTGSGEVATFRLLCLKPIESEISIYRSPIHETRVVLSDGRSEKEFKPAAPLVISVTGNGVPESPWSTIKHQAR